MLPPQAISVIQDTVACLASGNYYVLENDGRAGRLDAQQINYAITKYGKQLTVIPLDELAQLESCIVDSQAVPTFAVDIDLWTIEEGKSDLTLSIWLTEVDHEYRLEILDIRVQ